MKTVAITGNTYPVRVELYRLGGKWNAGLKAWMVPSDKETEAKKIVTDGPAKGSLSIPRPSKCKVCGAKASRWIKIYRSGECGDCYEERKMGY